jgi:hypothetical protein
VCRISALRPNDRRLTGEIAIGTMTWVTPVDYLTQPAPEARCARP